jgi:pimeloyl-ACP methyl ester carboxylesterase
MQSRYIDIGTEQVHYLQAGSGRKLLLAFHGYGNDAYIFKYLARHVQDEFTLILVDLPHHGNTTWGESKLSKQDLRLLVEKWMTEFSIGKVTLLGYSIGGRVCLCITEQLPELVDQCLLIAPDGLMFNPLYYFVTRNRVGKWLFRKFLEDEKNTRWITKLNRLNLIDDKKYRFAMHYLKTEADRRKLHDIWMNLSLLVPDSKYLEKIIRENKIHITIFMGQKDNIIPLVKARKFMNKLPTVTLHILQKGHRMLDNETISLIAKTIADK